MLWNGSWKYNNILFYSCLHFLNRFNKFVNIFFIYVWIWYKYDNILFYSCLYFLNRFNKFVNIFFIHVWIWYNCKQLSSTHNFCAHIFSTASEKTLRFVRIQILTVDSGISMQFNYLNCNIIYLCAYKKYYCVSFFFSKLSRIFPCNLLFCMGTSIFLWQLARLARPPAHSPPGTCRLPSTYHHEPFLHERWCDRPVFIFGSLFEALYWNFCLFFDFLHAISWRSPHFCWLLCFDRWADFFGLFLLICCSNDFHFMFSFLRHSSGFFAPFWFCAR